MSNELLEKVITTTALGAEPGQGGLLSPDQSNRFIDYMWDATVLGGQVRTMRLRGDTAEVDRIGVGERLLRVATEAVDDGLNVGIAFSKVSLTTTKYRLDWELSSEALEDGVKGDPLEDHVARLMAAQVAQDLEDIAINGDTTLTDDPTLKGVDGWAKRGETDGHVVDNGGATIDRAVFNKALKAMPRKFMQRRNGLKFFTGSNLIQDYLFSLQNTSTDFVTPESMAAAGINSAVRTSGPAGFVTGNAFGIPVQEVPLMDENKAGDYSGATGAHGDVWLTDPQNLIWAVKRDITVYREFKPKKDSIEFTTYVRFGTNIENGEAFVVVKNVKAAV